MKVLTFSTLHKSPETRMPEIDALCKLLRLEIYGVTKTARCAPVNCGTKVAAMQSISEAIKAKSQFSYHLKEESTGSDNGKQESRQTQK
jgi:hypothetical protein